MARIPLTARMLVLLPLLAAGVDLTRAQVACGQHAETCLEAAGRGWLGGWATVLLIVYAAGAGLLLARAARAPRGSRAVPPGFLRLWALGTTGLVTVCTGQELVARLLGGEHAPLGGTPLGVFALCAVAGALLAWFMRAASAAAELISLRAPRLPQYAVARVVAVRHRPDPAAAAVDGRPRGRAPPAA